jgi:hypothetical protein
MRWLQPPKTATTDRDVVEPVGPTRTRIKKEEIAGQ